MKYSVKLQDGHHSLKLPFKKEEIFLPNNHGVAKQRILGLKRRFERDEKFHQEYTNFLSDAIKEGYAEHVPGHQLKRSDGRFWYIPHLQHLRQEVRKMPRCIAVSHRAVTCG